MPRKRTSPIWVQSKEDFAKLVQNSKSKKEILQYFFGDHIGNNFATLNRRLEEEKIDCSHLKGERFCPRTIKTDIGQILTVNSQHSRCNLKRRLIEEKILVYSCAICGLKGEWQGLKLSLVLDHINGVPNDNRIENLRFLCPNCNSQTDTFSGKNKVVKRNHCVGCGTNIRSKSTVCPKCSGFKKRKATRPDTDVLVEQVKRLGYCATARLYGVTDNAIRKWLKLK